MHRGWWDTSRKWYILDMAHSSPAESYDVRLGDRGRLVLPSRLRKRLGLKRGDRLVLVPGPRGVMTFRSLRQIAQSCQGVFRHLAPGRSLAAELIRERREEAAREERGG